MKRYWLFGGENYYAKGGIHDFIASTDYLELLVSQAKKLNPSEIDWYHIVDSDTGNIILKSNCQAFGVDDD